MKTSFFFWTVALMLSVPNTHLFAQKKSDRIFQGGQKDCWVGVGLVPTYLMDGAEIILPPVTFGGDYMLADHLSIGAQFGYSVSGFQKIYPKLEHPKTYRNGSYFFGARGAAHCTKIPNWDIYGGFNLGYNIAFISVLNGEFGTEESSAGILEKNGHFTYTGFLGLKYVCCSNIGLFGEIGFGASIIMVGLTYRI